MNTIEFIDQMAEDGVLGNFDARGAYNTFIDNVGREQAGSFEYFRTKFNNKCKSLMVASAAPEAAAITYTEQDVETANAIVEGIAVAQAEKVQRRTYDYKDGDEIPEQPDLMPTGTMFDEYVCDRVTTEEEKAEYFNRMGEHMPESMIEMGGFTRQCIDIVAGDPGAGKTYSRNILAAKAKLFAAREQGKQLKVHFISGEMRSSEWAKELKKCVLLEEVVVTYMLDYVGLPNYEEIFWDAFSDGDIIVCDSLPAIIGHFRMSWDPARGKMPTETQMIYTFIRESLKSVEECDNNVQLINQATKDGNYKGGTELPHMMSSMSFVKIDRQSRKRYMTFEKNRNNGETIKRQLYFDKIECGDLVFNQEAYDATYNQIMDKKQDLTSFVEDLHRNQNGGSDTELSAEEMGTAGPTQEDLAAIDSPGSMFGDQTNLEDEIAELQEAELAENDLEDELDS
jgi:hypothetical protein